VRAPAPLPRRRVVHTVRPRWPSVHRPLCRTAPRAPTGLGWEETTAHGRRRTEESRVRCRLAHRFARIRRTAEAGMTTAEYAVGTLAACAFAAVLLVVVKSGGVKSALAAVITAALGTR